MLNNDPLFANPSLVGDLVAAAGFQVKQVCLALGLRAADLGVMTRRKVEAVARYLAKDDFQKLEDEDTKRILSQLVQIIGLLRAMKLDDKASDWFRAPLPSYGGRTPIEVIKDGEGQQLVTKLMQLETGNLGG